MTWPDTEEHRRLKASQDREADWKNWGPYVADRAWGTVREDYSAGGKAWEYFTHDHARSRAYRWNEDGLAGVCNRFQNICMAIALWNGVDPILKERFFGVTGPQGNHGEDVKEYYFHLDSTPTHSYMKMLYKYPQVEYPYQELVDENGRRSVFEREYELFDALKQAFEQDRYFDVFVEYAKAGEEDILCRITAINRGPTAAPLHILPHLWYRNTWSWGHSAQQPQLQKVAAGQVHTGHRHLGERFWYVDLQQQTPELMFTGNDTNKVKIFGARSQPGYTKDAFHETVVDGLPGKVNPDFSGTKAAAHYQTTIKPGESFTVYTRFCLDEQKQPFADAAAIFDRRIAEADEFYEAIHAPDMSAERKKIQRQAFAGLMWTKQFYHYSVELWLDGDPTQVEPPAERLDARNSHWRHLYNLDVISMPDKWEYPWYAAWDLAFHTLPIAMIDPEWAKRQLILMLRTWYMHPNGQIPAYEWSFGDVNPPVHAWATWRVYEIDRDLHGRPDVPFLEEVFHKLLLNFTWWVNRKDNVGNNIFEGGFLGLDNIGLFDRSHPLPGIGRLEQADGTGWMAMYCLNMLKIALELATRNNAYESIAVKFFEHFVHIGFATNTTCGHGGLWDEEDGFYYDMLRGPDGSAERLKIRSFVGLIPLFAVETMEEETIQKLPSFRRRMNWFLKYRPHLTQQLAPLDEPGVDGRRLLSLACRDKTRRIVDRLLDPAQFLSDFGLRSLSKEHEDAPYSYKIHGRHLHVGYEPGESQSGMFGGNSNWRGPVWFPVNFMMMESLRKLHSFYGDRFATPDPNQPGKFLTLEEAAGEIGRRLIRLFEIEAGRRPFKGGNRYMDRNPHWRDHLQFHEYFHGDTGEGLGASHQTGWTALVAKLIQQAQQPMP